MKKLKLLVLSLLSGTILGFSWVPHGIPFLIFFAFIPLFFVSQQLEGERFSFWKGIGYSFPGLLVWNVLTTWWVGNCTLEGSIAMVVLNSFFMSIFFGLWQWFKATQPPKLTIPIGFIAFWSTWEYLHLNWDLTWPWLNLGNVFASCTEYVQWYEYTGTFGGTWWILLVNFLLFYLIRILGNQPKRKIILLIISILPILFLPILTSQILYHHYSIAKENPMEVIIVQQNTDPWEEEYRLSNAEQTYRLLTVTAPLVTPKTELIVCAESSIPHTLQEKGLLAKDYPSDTYNYYGFVLLDSFIAQHPGLNFVLGLSTAETFSTKATPTAREIIENQVYIDYYNTSGLYTKNGLEKTYHKSKLVPGVEKMPFPKVFGFLEKVIIDLGGSSGSLGCDTFQRCFEIARGDAICRIGCPICYESAYGEHFGKFVQHGAELMAVITNDSWWDDSPGHIQHFLFSKLRAIETRRYITRAANGGNSAFIDPRGDVHQKTEYEERLAIRDIVYLNNEITFYTRHGDYLARIAVFLNFVCLLYGALWHVNRKVKSRLVKTQ